VERRHLVERPVRRADVPLVDGEVEVRVEARRKRVDVAARIVQTAVRGKSASTTCSFMDQGRRGRRRRAPAAVV
jgi:hypothetical protein